MTNPVDVIVVGGGFAGISAARELHKAGRSFLVLEARDRLGGRVHSSTEFGGEPLELGGQWIGPGQEMMYDLVNEFGIKMFRTFDTGRCILDLNGKITTYSGLIPKVDPLSLFYIDRAIRLLDKMARSIDLDAPWTHPKARQWDNTTLEAFLLRKVKRIKALKILYAGFETVLACNPNEISLLHALFYIRSGRDVNTLISIENGAQQDRIIGGMQQIVEKMAAPFPESIKFEEPVSRIEQFSEYCIASTPKNKYMAKKIIVAIPPVLSGRIAYSPSLKVAKQQLLQKVPMGIVIKCHAVYDHPFWRESGFSGEVVADDNFPYQTIFDNSTTTSKFGILMGFSLAARANRMTALSKEERKALMVETLTRYFGKKAENILYYEDKCWAEEAFSQGCYTGYFPPGIWTTYHDEIRKPEGNIHWAGTETATVWNGYIEGAVRSGKRAVKEILEIDPI